MISQGRHYYDIISKQKQSRYISDTIFKNKANTKEEFRNKTISKYDDNRIYQHIKLHKQNEQSSISKSQVTINKLSRIFFIHNHIEKVQMITLNQFYLQITKRFQINQQYYIMAYKDHNIL